MSTKIIPPMYEKRSQAAVATIGDDSFIVIWGYGGKATSSPPWDICSTCEVYDGGSNTWTRLPKDMPKGRFGSCAATIGRHIYVVGGSNYVATTSMVAYSLDEKKWVSKKPMKQQQRSKFTSAASNGRLFVFGGYRSHDEEMMTSEVYDPETDTWNDIPPMPTTRFRCAAVSVDDKIYVMGGFGGGDSGDRLHDSLSSVDIFNVTTEQWEKGPDMPTPRFAHAAVTIGKFIVVIGGSNEYDQVLLQTQIYDIDAKKWSNGPSLTTGRCAHIAVLMKENRVVIAGGHDNEGNYLNTAEEITFNLNNKASTVRIFSRVHRSINQVVNNETISLSSRTKKLEKELGVSVKGSIRARIQKMEKEVYGSIRKGALAIRLDKLETDTFS